MSVQAKPGSVMMLRLHHRLHPGVLVLGYVLVALGVAFVLVHVDRGSTVTAATARQELFTIAAGMLPFIAVLFSLLFVVVQWAHTTFSPRLRLFRDAPLLWHAFGLFTGTITYALAEGLLIADRHHVSAAIELFSFAAVAASVTVAALLVRRALDSVELPTVLDALSRHGMAVIDEVHPDELRAGTQASEPSLQPVTQSVRCLSSGLLQEIDLPALVDLASAAGGCLRLQVMVGDSLSQDQPVMTLSAPLLGDEPSLNRCLRLGVERTFSQDPKYVLRILADIGVRALSPAVNDPTTAVEVLNVVERLLARLATRDLGNGVQRDAAGTPRVVFLTADWEDYVSVGIDEIRLYGSSAIQVSRRLVSLLETLIGEVPAVRREVLVDRLQRLHRVIAETFSDPCDRAQAAASDRQGLGGFTAPTR